MTTRAERNGLKVTRCSSCGHPITWIELPPKKEGELPRQIPLDASAPCYFLIAEDAENERIAHEGPHAYVSHFSTCPDASMHSKRSRAS